MRLVSHRLHVLYQSEEIGRLRHHARGVVVQGFFQRVKVGKAVFVGNFHQFEARSVGVSFCHGNGFGIDRAENQNLAFLFASHNHGFADGGAHVVNRSIGNIHAGKFAHERLIFEYGLKNTLTYFGLIWRICGYELAPCRQRPDRSGYKMVVSAAASQNGVEHLVFGRRFLVFALDSRLTHALPQPELFEHKLFGHVGVESVQTVQAHCVKHGFYVRGVRSIFTHFSLL